jgi:transposase
MPNVVELPDDVEALKKLVIELQARAEAQRERIAILEHNIEVLTKIAFEAHGVRRPSASFSADLFQGQLLFPELVEAAERVADRTGESGTVEVKKTGNAKKGHGRRKSFPAHLPVIRTNFEPPAEERVCPCGAELKKIGEDVSRELERLEICVVHEIARGKYACKTCEETVKTAKGPERVIDKGLLGAGFLAHVIVERFLHHLPYHRLEKKYFSEGLDLSRVVLCESTLRCAELLEPVYEELVREMRASRVIHTDDTSVHVAERKDGSHKDAHVWIYLGEGDEHVYDYTESRNRDGPREMLRGYTGYMQADAYTATTSSTDQRARPRSRAGPMPGATSRRPRPPTQNSPRKRSRASDASTRSSRLPRTMASARSSSASAGSVSPSPSSSHCATG